MLDGAWLTKSRFLAGKQCPKRLWQQCHSPLETGNEPSPITETGLKVGQLVHQLFPNGAVAWTEGQTVSQAIAATTAFVKNESAPAIFEAALQSGQLFARVDILERGQRGAWNICEVKSSTEVKDEHIDDVAFQLHVANEAGLKVSRVEIVHVNKDYVLKEQGLEPKRYFQRVDVTAKAKKRSRDIPGMIAGCLKIADKDRTPDVEPWTQCHTPYDCEFLDRCTANKPNDWIFYLPHLGEKRGELLRAKGIETIAKIPDDVELTKQQTIIRDVYRTGHPYISPGLKSALRPFGPPAYYLDFEAMSPAIPLYTGTRPYERLPFQWSLHERDKKGNLQHSGFLADGRNDPREAFAECLLDKLGSSTEPIIVYSAFERATLNQLANVLKGHRKAIKGITARLRDLLAIVREHVYYADLGGSYSIKSEGGPTRQRLCPARSTYPIQKTLQAEKCLGEGSMLCSEQRHDLLDFSNCLPVCKWAIINIRAQRLRRCQAKKLGRNRKVSGRPASDRPVKGWISPRLYEALMTRGGRLRLAFVAAILILGVAIGGQIYGRVVAAREILERDATIQQLQSEIQKLEVELYFQNGKLAALQSKFTTFQATLETILPAADTYNIDPNQAIIVAGGRLTIGLIGSPTNEGINININGKQHAAAAGDVIHVALDPSTNCQVGVQSFDMFKAVLTASCAGVKPH